MNSTTATLAPHGAARARFWDTTEDGRVHCYLCPRHCTLAKGQRGFCAIRENADDELVLLGYGRPTAIQVDPIEKKPLSHYLPGSSILSLGNAGCNMGCLFCQNWDISKAKADHRRSTTLAPDAVVALARQQACPSIAYTYNEPTTWAEYVIDIANEAHAAGLHNVVVSNGYTSPQAWDEFYAPLDAANIDLKAFTDSFYGRLTFTKLQPVLDTLRYLAHETDVWFEITTLIIPGHNDSPDELARAADWIVTNLGPDVPWHFSAFHPDYKLTEPPRTAPESLTQARAIARAAGCRYVYTGNVHDRDGGTTACPACARVVVERDWHRVIRMDVAADGTCPACATPIPGRWHAGGLTIPQERPAA